MEIDAILRMEDSPERTAALVEWQYWRSAVDGANAWLIWRTHRGQLDLSRLQVRVREAGWDAAFEDLMDFDRRWTRNGPTEEELESWATAGPRSR